MNCNIYKVVIYAYDLLYRSTEVMVDHLTSALTLQLSRISILITYIEVYMGDFMRTKGPGPSWRTMWNHLIMPGSLSSQMYAYCVCISIYTWCRQCISISTWSQQIAVPSIIHWQPDLYTVWHRGRGVLLALYPLLGGGYADSPSCVLLIVLFAAVI